MAIKGKVFRFFLKFKMQGADSSASATLSLL